jgi:hypothetical protein
MNWGSGVLAHILSIIGRGANLAHTCSHSAQKHGNLKDFYHCMKYSDVDGSSLIWLSWIRIRIGNADPYLGARKLTKIYKET